MATLSALDQFLNPNFGWLPPSSAQKLVGWTVTDELRERIEDLGRKANMGELTPEEDAEYREYLDDAEIISLLQAKARQNYRIDGLCLDTRIHQLETARGSRAIAENGYGGVCPRHDATK